MSACGANSFGWSSFAQNPPRRRDLLLEMHDGREKFVARLCDLNPALVNKSELWWRLTGIAKEQLEHGGEWARLINGEVVVLPADAVMGAEMIAPEQRRSWCICGAMLTSGKCLSCAHVECSECEHVPRPTVETLTAELSARTAERDEALRKSSRGVWRCFHCDEVFDTPGGARDHFGAAQGDTPGCLLKVQLGDERGWLMELRKEQDAHEQQLQRALDAEREVETLECRVASLSSAMKSITPFAKCDSMRDVFNVYDSMEGRALAAEERERVLREALEHLLEHTEMRGNACKLLAVGKARAALATPAQPQTGGSK